MKLKFACRAGIISSRSREGAWIETYTDIREVKKTSGRSREGAWIETILEEEAWKIANNVAPVRERGLKHL